jgi:hypothetical protein
MCNGLTILYLRAEKFESKAIIHLKDVSERVWKGTVMAHLMVLLEHFPGRTEENYETYRSG